MSQKTIDLFQASIMKTTEILSEIEGRLDIVNERKRSYHVLRAVLHAIRDRLPVNESVDLASQLPLLVKAAYYDGWSPGQVPIKMNKQEFLNRINDEIGLVLGYSPEEIVAVVLTALRNFVSKGEIEDIKAVWPADLNEIFKE
jgi:uncharacterized protein (DUF2267 family)